MKKNIYFESGNLTVGKLGAALSGSGQKIEFMTVCKKVNADNLCLKFPNMKMKLELSIFNRIFNFKVMYITRELLMHFAKDKKITSHDLDEIVQLKMQDLNTSNVESAKKTILSYAKVLNIEVI